MKTISLANSNLKVLIDDDDYKKVCNIYWQLHVSHGNTYARCANENGKTQYMHQLILGKQDGYTIDHRDRDGLNNQKYNLRHATYSTQNHNRLLKNKHNLAGVNQVGKKFRAKISHNGRRIHIGYYSTALAAHNAYKEKAKEIYG